ncbi:unnamed protein product [Phytomonas sp. EM1]|nr:unnamed protein product [Phytomonas sp. EM1]|eukprot:CCW65729.1 unnamed protein product [Phytomonas sp. isolate EM1]
MLRILLPHSSRRSAPVLLVRRFRSGNGDADEKREADSAATESLNYKKSIKAENSVSAQDVLRAVKGGDFAKMQLQATKLVQESWNDKYSVSLACIIVLATMWYWIAWTRRSIRRKCAAIEAAVQQDSETTLELVRNLTTKWERDLKRTNERMEDIIDKNSDLTETIDHMTTALRSCISRPLPSLAGNSIKGKETTSTEV